MLQTDFLIRQKPADKDRTPARAFIVKINTKTYETVIVDGPTKIGGFRAATKMNNKLYFAGTGATPYLLEIDPANGDATQVVCYSFIKQINYIKQLIDMVKPEVPEAPVVPEAPEATGDEATADETGKELAAVGAYIPANLFASTATMLADELDATFDEAGDMDDFIDYKEKFLNAFKFLKELSLKAD